MRRRLFSMFVIIIFVATLWGCASTGSVSSKVSPTTSISSFKTLSVGVQSKVEDSKEEVQIFKGILISKLERGGWGMVGDGSQGQLEISATITNLYKVGGTARVLLGALAGQASVDVDVVMKDAKGNIISQFSVNGKSSGGTIFAGTTEQALERAAEQIVAFLKSGK